MFYIKFLDSMTNASIISIIQICRLPLSQENLADEDDIPKSVEESVRATFSLCLYLYRRDTLHQCTIPYEKAIQEDHAPNPARPADFHEVFSLALSLSLDVFFSLDIFVTCVYIQSYIYYVTLYKYEYAVSFLQAKMKILLLLLTTTISKEDSEGIFSQILAAWNDEAFTHMCYVRNFTRTANFVSYKTIETTPWYLHPIPKRCSLSVSLYNDY